MVKLKQWIARILPVSHSSFYKKMNGLSNQLVQMEKLQQSLQADVAVLLEERPSLAEMLKNQEKALACLENPERFRALMNKAEKELTLIDHAGQELAAISEELRRLGLQQERLEASLKEQRAEGESAAGGLQAGLAALGVQEEGNGSRLEAMQEELTSLRKVYGGMNGSFLALKERLNLLQGSYAELNEIFRIPQEQPFPKYNGAYSLAGTALERLLSDYSFDTVLDIGCGEGQHSSAFLKAGKRVAAINLCETVFMQENRDKMEILLGDFNEYPFTGSFDCVWASHVLEHQYNAHQFLRKIHSVLKEGGILAVTVPPPRQLIGGGHVSLWNAGLLLYNLVLAGFDCHEAQVLRYGYNIAVLLAKRSIEELGPDSRIDDLRRYFPEQIEFIKTWVDYHFDGDIG